MTEQELKEWEKRLEIKERELEEYQRDLDRSFEACRKIQAAEGLFEEETRGLIERMKNRIIELNEQK